MQVQLAERVSHDANVVQFYGAAVAPHAVLLVMELMQVGRRPSHAGDWLQWDAGQEPGMGLHRQIGVEPHSSPCLEAMAGGALQFLRIMLVGLQLASRR
jgi:hypothetical protein